MTTLALKLFLFLVGVYLLVSITKKALKVWIRGLLSGPEPPKAGDLVACAQCGTYVAPDLGHKKGKQVYCSPECKALGPKA